MIFKFSCRHKELLIAHSRKDVVNFSQAKCTGGGDKEKEREREREEEGEKGKRRKKVREIERKRR